MTPRIIATGPITSVVGDILDRFGKIELAPADDESTLISLMPDTIGIIVRGTSRITRKVIESAPQLRVIGRTGVGYETIDLNAVNGRGIPVITTPGANARAVAESALAMLLVLAKNLRLLDVEVRAGRWNARHMISSEDLQGKTLGIVGLGMIGVELARLSSPFGMLQLAHDPLAPAERFADLGVQQVELDDLLGQSDLVSLHLPLTPQTHGMFDRERLAKFKTGAILVNLARGGLFSNLSDLHQALESGQLSALGLDVFPEEPPDFSHPLFSHPATLFSPHTAGTSRQAMQRILSQMAEGMAAVFAGELPASAVNRQAVLDLRLQRN